jgi:hypothetical protein
MSPGHKIRTAFVVLVLFTGAATASIDDNPGQPEVPADARLARVLKEWEQRSSGRKSIDIRLVREDRDNNWGEKEIYTGRVVLLPKGPAFVDMMKRDRAGQVATTERLVWTKEEFHQIRLEQKMHFVWPIAQKDQGRLPSVLALPFFWHLSSDALKSRYQIELLKEQPDTWLFRIKPLADMGRQSFSMAYLFLDRSTFLPRRFYLISPNGKTTQDFRVTEVRPNHPAPTDLITIPEGSDWDVRRMDRNVPLGWLSSLLKTELLP